MHQNSFGAQNNFEKIAKKRTSYDIKKQRITGSSVSFLPCGLAMRILSVRPSVCPSVTRVNCDKTVERYVQINIP